MYLVAKGNLHSVAEIRGRGKGPVMDACRPVRGLVTSKNLSICTAGLRTKQLPQAPVCIDSWVAFPLLCLLWILTGPFLPFTLSFLSLSLLFPRCACLGATSSSSPRRCSLCALSLPTHLHLHTPNTTHSTGHLVMAFAQYLLSLQVPCKEIFGKNEHMTHSLA